GPLADSDRATHPTCGPNQRETRSGPKCRVNSGRMSICNLPGSSTGRAFPTKAFSPIRQMTRSVVAQQTHTSGSAAEYRTCGRAIGLDIRVVTPDGPRSIGGAIARGLEVCRWDLVCVMDADLSHPPGLIPSLIASLDGADGVVASRYVPGADIESWPARRHL